MICDEYDLNDASSVFGRATRNRFTVDGNTEKMEIFSIYEIKDQSFDLKAPFL